ncbi:tetratricopeptide repeat protein [Pedosphaera parvula]|uniref:Tetratricopeptide TPR_2 repeat protein n=1 Tax=Pedosphaera parvula (strain Ellin514) TaxID=320771 RepID=B9XDX0_PEDPL|nr:tetratricopeptide repeat protein [Pedosphaera parvula]EEF61861.1 Tetratricopeptide TPR_2 repeat protein [Pedosphaera parvula Ellin514]
MRTERESSSNTSYVRSLLPWILAALMMVVYIFTLNHSYSLGNLGHISELAGWNWRSTIAGPVTFLLTLPFRWLPVKILPLALNLFAAFLGALTLALLARSVALLPRDRTQEQREREPSTHALLSTKTAWIPPLLAVLVCGLQMTFWEHAIEFTGEMVDLLLFSYCIRCLLEFRIEEKESWLIKFALVCGLGMANSWAMIGYLPAFILALIWIKGVRFFQISFMLKLMGCGLLGFLLILLLPLKAALAHPENVTFFKLLKVVLSADKNYLSGLWHYFPKETWLVLALPFLLPLVVMGIRWSSFFGDTSPFGIFLAKAAFHIVHALFLGACVWVALDPPFSPRISAHGTVPFLSFYYLGALNVGYFSGYFLLIFRPPPVKSRHRNRPNMQLPNHLATACICLLVVLTPLLLVCRNLPKISANLSQNFVSYNNLIEQSLPKKGAVILSDDPLRLQALQTHLGLQGRDKEYLFVESSVLQEPAYFKYLNKKYPQYRLLRGGSQSLDSISLINLMTELSKEYEVFYLNYSFGYYFEEFYKEPHGLIFQLKGFDKKASMLPPAPNSQDLAENQAFWEKIDGKELSSLKGAITTSAPQPNLPLIQHIFTSLHLTKEPDYRALYLGTYYSTALNSWGVTLERAGKLNDAEKYFQRAEELNPDNVPSQVNGQFNKDLLAGKKPVIAPPRRIEDKFGKHHDWTDLLKQDGPFDEPNFCYQLGVTLARGGNYRQAIEQFDRARTLTPENNNCNLWLAQLYISTLHYSNALAAVNKALDAAPNDPDALFFKGISLIQLKDYDGAIPPLNQLLNLQTNNYSAKLNRAIAYLHSGDLSAARKDYESITSVAPKVYQAYYGLAEIAYRNKDKPAAINYYKSYLTNAPPDTDEVKQVESRLKELGAGSP